MNFKKPNNTPNVLPFQKRLISDAYSRNEPYGDNIIRMLDLSKFDRPRPADNYEANMRTNIAAMIFLGILIFVATEDFGRLEQSNLCSFKSDCLR